MDRELTLLQEKFGNTGVTFRRGAGDFIFAAIENQLAQAEICLYGAHLLSYIPAGQPPILWMSSQSWFTPGKAIRGGVPICWPWFGAHPKDSSLPAHGFARLSLWQLKEVLPLASGATKLVLHLDRGLVPAGCCTQDFELEYSVTIGKLLTLELNMTNCDVKIMEVSAALHTYFAVSDIAAVEVKGLGGAEFIDKVHNEIGREKEKIHFTGETDRIYPDTDAEVTILDRNGDRKIKIEKIGSRSTVVWNPWIEKAHKTADFGDEEYRQMLCVETGILNRDTRRLAPGESWILGCRIGYLE